MEELTTEELVKGIRDWAMDRFDMENMPIGDCRALYEEFAEWFEPQGDELELYQLMKLLQKNFRDTKNALDNLCLVFYNA